MFKLNEKAFPRLSRDDKGLVKISAYKLFNAFHQDAEIGMTENEDDGFTYYRLDGYGDPIQLSSMKFYYKEFEKKYVRGEWMFIRTMV